MHLRLLLILPAIIALVSTRDLLAGERLEQSAARFSKALMHDLAGQDLQSFLGHSPKIEIRDHPLPFATTEENGLLVLSLELFRVSSEPSALAFVIAHELAHLRFGHTHHTAPAQQLENEIAADAYALQLLSESGFSLKPVVPFMRDLGASLGGFPSISVRAQVLAEHIALAGIATE